MDAKYWRLKQLEDTQKDLDSRIESLERFQYSTIEKLKIIFQKLKDIENTNRWLSRSFFYIIFSGAIGVIFSMVVWLLQHKR